jgi:adenylyl-sulfate kinase
LASRAEDWQRNKNFWPQDLRNQIVDKGWKNIASIHVCNPWQRTDEYLLKCALEGSDALLLHICNEITPELGGLLPGVLSGASRLLLENYFPVDRILENMAPDGLFGSSPRASLQHAILSQNYGCSSIYLPLTNDDTVVEQGENDIFVEAASSGLTIRRVYLDRPFHCDLCGGIATEKSCPHEPSHRVTYSEAAIVDRLLTGEHLPPTVARPDIARAVARGMADKAVTDGLTGKHLYPHVSEVSRELVESLAGHKAGVLWMTGLSGSGKSTIAHRIERDLIVSGHRVYVLDGDTLRAGLNRDLAFGEEARRENLRRAAEVVKVLIDAGLIVIASFISPFKAERQMVREIVGANFFEVFVEASIEICEERDPKGLYKRARAGVIPKFTGVSSPYEAPDDPDIRLNTDNNTLEECVNQLTGFIAQAGLMRALKHG